MFQYKIFQYDCNGGVHHANADTETKLVFTVHTNTSFVDCFSVLYDDDADACC